MNLTKEQVSAGVSAGLALTNPESELMIPVKHATGVLVLHQLLIGIASGKVRLEAASAEAPEPPAAAPPND